MKFSVRYKFAIGLLLIFCLCFNLMTVYINNIVMKNNEQVINSELLDSQRDLDIYFKQFVIINDMTASQEDFEKNFSEIGTALSSKLNNRIVLYKKDGNLIFDTDHSDGNMYSDSGAVIEDDFMDLELAVEGQPAYKIVKINDTYKVIFSEPLCTDKTTVGILRYTKDYTELFETGNDLMLKIKIFMLFMFLILFIFSFLLSTKIIIPIIKLNRSTKEISNGNFNFDVLVESNDEIGELGESFNIMKGKIKEQIETIEKDRDELIKLEGHRKVFYDNVTHEMKTPLTIIDGYAQMILDEGISDEKLILKAASKIKKESNNLHHMIVDILNMSKLESNIDSELKEKLNITHIIKNICDDMSIKAKKYEISIEEILEDDVYICASKEDICRMLVNIIDNSIKYGNVKSIIRISLFKDDNNCTIVLEDEGKGITNEALKRIFEPFYRASNGSLSKSEGNGLGLSIVKAIVDKYEGAIEIKSEVNKGTKVYIKIPLFYNLATS